MHPYGQLLEKPATKPQRVSSMGRKGFRAMGALGMGRRAALLTNASESCCEGIGRVLAQAASGVLSNLHYCLGWTTPNFRVSDPNLLDECTKTILPS